MLNYLHSKAGISTTLSARIIFEGRPNLDHNTISLNLVAYIQLYKGGETRITEGR